MKRLFLLCAVVIAVTPALHAARSTAEQVRSLSAARAYETNPQGMDRMRWDRLLPRLEAEAEQGDHRALYRLASLLQEGRGVARDESRAQDYFSQAYDRKARHLASEKAFEQGAGGMGRIAWGRALKELETQADNGDYRALYRLGRFYQKGQGVRQDEARALNYIQRAADHGYGRALYRMGQFAERGYSDLVANKDAAREWYKLAYDAGTSKSLQSLERLLEADAERARNSSEPWNERVHALGQIAKYTDTDSKDGQAYLRSALPKDMGLFLNDRGALNFAPGEVRRMRDDEARRAQVAALFDEMSRGLDSSPLTFDRYYTHEVRKQTDADGMRAEMEEEADLIAAIKLLKMARVKDIEAKVRTTLWEQAEAKLAAGNEVLLRKYGTQFSADTNDIVLLPALRAKPIDTEQVEVQAQALFTDDRLETVLFLRRQYAKTRTKAGIKGPGYLMPEKTYDDAMVIGVGALHAVYNDLRARLHAGTARDTEWKSAVQFLTALCDAKKLQGKKLVAAKFVSQKESVLTAAAKGLSMSPGHRIMVQQFLTEVPTGLAGIPLTFQDEQFVLPYNDKALFLEGDVVLPLSDVQRLAQILNPLITIPGLRQFIVLWDDARAHKMKEKVSGAGDLIAQWRAAVRTIVAAANDGRISSREAPKYLTLISPVLPSVVGRGWIKGEGLIPVSALLEEVPKSKGGKLAAHMKKISAQYAAFMGKETEEEEELLPPPSPAASVRTIDTDVSSVALSDDEAEDEEDTSVDDGKVVRLELSSSALELAKSKLKKTPVPEKKEKVAPEGKHGFLLANAAKHADVWQERVDQVIPDDEENEEGWSDDEDDTPHRVSPSPVKQEDASSEKKKQRRSRFTFARKKPSSLPKPSAPLSASRPAKKPIDFAAAMRQRRAAMEGVKVDDENEDPLDPTALSEKEKRAELALLERQGKQRKAEQQQLQAHEIDTKVAQAAGDALEKRFKKKKPADDDNFTGSNPLYRQEKNKEPKQTDHGKGAIRLTEDQQRERAQQEEERRMKMMGVRQRTRRVARPLVLDLSDDG